MKREYIELGMKCCNEFLCSECPYEKYDDKVNKEYTIRCIHMLMQDINKLYFGDDGNSWNNSSIAEIEVEMKYKSSTIKVNKESEKRWIVFDDISPIVGKGISRESAFKCYYRGLDLIQQKYAGIETGINEYLDYLEQQKQKEISR